MKKQAEQQTRLSETENVVEELVLLAKHYFLFGTANTEGKLRAHFQKLSKSTFKKTAFSQQCVVAAVIMTKRIVGK